MRQGNGTELLGMNDPRSATIGVIYVSPNDDRKSVLAAILTQEKLGRKDIVIDLPVSNNAFQSSQDFKDLEKDVARKLQAKIIFIVTGEVADYARQRQFPVFPTLDGYTQSLDANNGDEKKETGAPERRWPFIGRKSKPLNKGAAVAGGAVAGAAAASELSHSEPGTSKAPGQQVHTPSSPDVEYDDQDVAQVPPRRGLVAPSPSTSSASTIDDDDAIDDTPSVPVRHGLGTTGAAAAGAAGGFLAGETLRRGQANPDLDAVGPTPLRSTPASPNTPAVTAVSPLSQGSPPPATPITNAPESLDEEAGADPGIIDLRPVPRAGGRSTVDLKGTAAAGAVPAPRPAEPPASRGAARRRNGGLAAAGLAGGLALGAGAAGSTAAGAPTAASGGANASGGAVISSPRPASGAPPPQRGIPPGRSRRGSPPPRRGRVLLVLLLLLLLLLASSFVCVSVNPGILPSSIIRPISNLLPAGLASNPTTITVTPDSKEVQDSYVMQAVTNQPNADQLQVGMRNLDVAPDAQSKTVAGTGRTQTQPSTASGLLTFTNGSSTAFTVSSAISIPGPDGVDVTPNTSVTIPAADPANSVFGKISVRAHATVAGTRGNLTAGVINRQCCTAGSFITVTNANFSGGVDPQTYTFVQRGDVNAVAAPLENTTSQQASTQFKQQLKPNEKLVVGPNCTPAVQIPAGTVGDQGHAIASTTVTVTAKCTGVAYDRGAAQAIAKDRLQKKAAIDPGQGYTLVGNIVPDVTVSKVNAESISLLVNARGIWAYQFDTAQQQTLAKQLAGKKVTDAQKLLSGQRGLTNAKIDMKTKGDTLPTDPTQITFNVQKVAGENASGNEDNNSGNPNSAPTPISGKGLVPSDNGKDKRA